MEMVAVTAMVKAHLAEVRANHLTIVTVMEEDNVVQITQVISRLIEVKVEANKAITLIINLLTRLLLTNNKLSITEILLLLQLKVSKHHLHLAPSRQVVTHINRLNFKVILTPTLLELMETNGVIADGKLVRMKIVKSLNLHLLSKILMVNLNNSSTKRKPLAKTSVFHLILRLSTLNHSILNSHITIKIIRKTNKHQDQLLRNNNRITRQLAKLPLKRTLKLPQKHPTQDLLNLLQLLCQKLRNLHFKLNLQPLRHKLLQQEIIMELLKNVKPRLLNLLRLNKSLKKATVNFKELLNREVLIMTVHLCIVMVITLLLPLRIRLKDTARLSTLNVLIITHSTKLKEVDLSLNLKMAITSVKM